MHAGAFLSAQPSGTLGYTANLCQSSFGKHLDAHSTALGSAVPAFRRSRHRRGAGALLLRRRSLLAECEQRGRLLRSAATKGQRDVERHTATKTLVLTRPVFYSRCPQHHKAFERPIARWMQAASLSRTGGTARASVPSFPTALRHIANTLQEPLQYTDFVAVERARRHVEALLRGGPQNLPAFEFLAPVSEEAPQNARGPRNRAAPSRYPSRSPGGVAPPHRYYELRLRPPGEDIVLRSSDYKERCCGRMGEECLASQDSNGVQSSSGSCEREGTAFIRVPGVVDWTAKGALEKWFARASRWQLFDDGTFATTQRPVIELSHREESAAAAPFAEPVVGFRIHDRQWSRYLCNHPRVIAIGDVHGCITELQDLLRVCDYRPGDELILLGDLVAKGPDSQAVVQMAREIGARAVRGNHDHEVIRCREAMMRGHDPSYASVDHQRIARQLSQQEHEWLRSCPWYIRSEDLETVFVHAGFQPDVPFEEQLPRHMMNLRSVLENGAPSARHSNGMAWARLWKGPLRVVFGHDAYMGLQLWDKCIGLDTGCVYGGRLTALLLPENRLISVPARKMYVAPRKRG
jgi:hypothetical protein